MRSGRVELPQYYYHQNLNLARLPVPPRPRGCCCFGIVRARGLREYEDGGRAFAWDARGFGWVGCPPMRTSRIPQNRARREAPDGPFFGTVGGRARAVRAANLSADLRSGEPKDAGTALGRTLACRYARARSQGRTAVPHARGDGVSAAASDVRSRPTGAEGDPAACGMCTGAVPRW